MRSLAGLLQQVEPVDVRKLHVEKEASRYIRCRIRVVLRRGTKRDHVQVIGRQQVSQRLADPAVIVHDKNDMVLGNHSREDAPLTGRSPLPATDAIRLEGQSALHNPCGDWAVDPYERVVDTFVQ